MPPRVSETTVCVRTPLGLTGHVAPLLRVPLLEMCCLKGGCRSGEGSDRGIRCVLLQHGVRGCNDNATLVTDVALGECLLTRASVHP